MVKHIQTIRRLTNCLSVFDHFMGLALEGLKAREELEKKDKVKLIHGTVR